MGTQRRTLEEFAAEGRVWMRDAIDETWLVKLRELSALDDKLGVRADAKSALFQAVCEAPFSRRLAELWPGMRPNRVVGFNKSSANNWALPWHQDRVVAMDSKNDSEEFTNWTRKSGIWHCEPPEHILNSMLFIRVHLDDVTKDNGAMEIAVGSHRLGKIRKQDVKDALLNYTHEVIEAKAGDVLILQMLTLHRSLQSVSNYKRRALRVDYAINQSPPANLA